MATTQSYDVVTDIMLPKLDGWSLIERLRQQKSITPVIILSAQNVLWTIGVRGLHVGSRRLSDQAIRLLRAASTGTNAHPQNRQRDGA